MAETGAEGARVRRGAEVTSRERMADAARSDVAARSLRVRRVTGVALPVRVEPDGNSHRSSAARGRGMAGDAAVLGSRRARVVLCVVELGVETANRGETFHRGISRV